MVDPRLLQGMKGGDPMDPSTYLGAITREPGPVKGGSTFIAFITDPDGYKIELIQRGA